MSLKLKVYNYQVLIKTPENVKDGHKEILHVGLHRKNVQIMKHR